MQQGAANKHTNIVCSLHQHKCKGPIRRRGHSGASQCTCPHAMQHKYASCLGTAGMNGPAGKSMKKWRHPTVPVCTCMQGCQWCLKHRAGGRCTADADAAVAADIAAAAVAVAVAVAVAATVAVTVAVTEAVTAAHSAARSTCSSRGGNTTHNGNTQQPLQHASPPPITFTSSNHRGRRLPVSQSKALYIIRG